MLKRSKLLVALLVVTVVCASVGFAVVQDNLTVDGSVIVDVSDIAADFNTDVQFVSATAVATPNSDVTITNPSVSVAGTDTNDKLTVTIPKGALTRVDDTVVVTAVVKNDNTKDATVTLVSQGNLPSEITVSVTEATITAGGNGNVVITFTLNDIPDASIGSTETPQAFSFELVATSAE